MRIDLRYVIPIGAFYLPGLLMLIGALALGYPLAETRGTIAVAGGFLGATASLTVALILLMEADPIWWRIPFTGRRP